jgi:glyoxylase-like metal-dependent hydrolase (beta-lactamase superfamily II)
MRRAVVLGVLLALGVMAAVRGQAPQGPKVVEVDKLKDNLYVLKGGGGNTAVFLTADGVTVVDAKNPGWGQPILDKIKELTPKPVTRLINTHTHGDHVSGNVDFPATIDIVTQENTKANMEKMDIFKQNAGRGLPKRTFKDKMTIGKGADQIDLYYFGPGHTNGDAIVVFPALRTAHTGDLFASKGLPFVDGNNGGSVLHYPETLNKAHAGIKDVDTIINGHLPTTTTWADLKTFAEFNQDFLTWAQSALKSGKPAKEAAAEWKLPSKYEALGYQTAPPTMGGGIEGRLQLLAEETKK